MNAEILRYWAKSKLKLTIKQGVYKGTWAFIKKRIKQVEKEQKSVHETERI